VVFLLCLSRDVGVSKLSAIDLTDLEKECLFGINIVRSRYSECGRISSTINYSYCE
jgi:hypothetical protein